MPKKMLAELCAAHGLEDAYAAAPEPEPPAEGAGEVPERATCWTIVRGVRHWKRYDLVLAPPALRCAVRHLTCVDDSGSDHRPLVATIHARPPS